jgi:class 3 adenylate cyclase
MSKRINVVSIFFWIVALVSINQFISNSSFFFDSLVKFDKVGKSVLVADLSSLPNGEYFFSLGKPTAPCDILFGGKVVERGISHSTATRNSLVIGIPLTVSNLAPGEGILRTECIMPNGFPIKFVDSPILTTRNAGLVLHGFRFLLHLVLGPTCALMLLIILINAMIWRSHSNSVAVTRIAFAVVALLHSLSLAYFPRLFISAGDAYVINAILRCAFAYTFLAVANRPRAFHGEFVMFAYFSFISLLVAHFFFSHYVNWTYRISFVLWTAAAIGLTISRWRRPLEMPDDELWRGALTIFAVLQGIDASTIFIEVLQPQMPMMLACMCHFIAKQANIDLRKNQDVYQTTYGVLEVVNDVNTDVRQKIVLATGILQKQSPMLRISAYIDSYCVGEAIASKMSMQRVYEHGYRKDTSFDSSIDISSGNGRFMKEAIGSGKPLYGIGANGGQFICVPIGELACINLSDHNARDPVFGHIANSFVGMLQPAIQAIEAHLKSAADSSKFAINRLRDTLGIGTYECALGAVFIDIVGYSQLSDKFRDPFRRFIADQYFPSLLKAIQTHMTLEFTRGDEAYFCVLEHFVAPGLSIAEELQNGLSACWRFQHEISPELCRQAGFPVIRLRIGAAMGTGTLSITSMEVKTLGEVVNHAKRLQEDAMEGEILITSALSRALPGSNLRFGALKRSLIKNNLIEARSVDFSDNGNEASSA